ncbi:FadD3 family acyl-CoA ligase [Amycolatopsis regifaucium]|uniref:Fatty acid--CoA ligase n=1 Tax=Amycolatopsis regifaucium TaxID=546365 RepID=A0A154MJA6_9PSEU|nr:FadD3 family acyl-CoA ligase [Amycolatopsis regifaucium]KZB84441.1 fatty acid--CoA ligase [Amycolatopsis regifaucium]OKA10904.1 fatty acid--CoA ligase [Amycolatopsis regifaucium]SFI21524.1 Acyl-CoA synthetase (AMP-forming)/AMP-acid ligase II [Amycolatopsis regifaucium]
MVEGTIPAALDRAADRFAGLEALVDGEVRLTYAELARRVRQAARFFEGHERVALCSPNTWHWVVAGLGALYAGATLVPVNTRFTARETLDILDRARVSALAITGAFLGTDRLADLGPARPGTVLRIPVEGVEDPVDGVTEWDALADLDGDFVSPARPGDISDILFTSGTTGRSKGAMSSHRQALSVAEAWAECGGLTENDRYLVLNPFFHTFGYKAGILAAVLRGAAILPQRTFDVRETLRLIETERVSVLPGAPTIYQVLLDAPERADHDLSSLRLAVTGAAPVPVPLVERMRSELGFDAVLTAYGLTEAVVATMSRPEDDAELVSNFSGRATAGFEVKLGENDEVLLRGPNVMLGYLDDPGATAKAVDAEGWLHTGDVGVLNERGYLKIVDRIKDMYVCGGFNVYPAEVEQVLGRLEGVAEAAVIGVPDERLGEVGKAFVRLRPGADLSTEDILTYCERELANYKLPRFVDVVAELPRTLSGKVLKRVLREENG